MDILHAEAEEIFRRQKFSDSESTLTLLVLETFKGSGPTYFTKNLSCVGFSSAILEQSLPKRDVTPTASMRLLHVSRLPQGGSYSVSADQIIDAISSFRINPYVLYMLASRIPDFHQVCSSTPDGERISTFFLNNNAFSLIWSFDYGTLTTNGIVISRRTTSGDKAFTDFWENLPLYQTLIGHPLFLAFVSSIRQLTFVNGYIKGRRQAIRDVENSTGSNLWPHSNRQPHDAMDEELDGLVNMSRAMGTTLVGLVDMMHHLKAAQKVFAALRDSSKDWMIDVRDENNKTVESTDRELSHVGFVLQSQIDSQIESATNYERRARTQVNVVSSLVPPRIYNAKHFKLYNLITRSDVQANIDVARAAKEDGSSMKTIAIMTMAFLPATFFAALFAMPMLEWDSSQVVKGRFWIYWAFTLPFTGLVFLLWFVITRRKQLLERLQGKSPAYEFRASTPYELPELHGYRAANDTSQSEQPCRQIV